MKRSYSLFITAALIGSALFFLNLYSHGEEIPLRKSFYYFPFLLGDWQAQELSFDKEIIQKLGVDDKLFRVYKKVNTPPIWLYIGYHTSQREGDLYHSPKHCYPGAGWVTDKAELIEIDMPNSPKGKVQVNKLLIRKGIDKQIVLYWYQSRGRIVANEYLDKFYLILDAMTRNRTDGALIRISAPHIFDEKRSTDMVVSFAKLVFTELPTYLPE